LNVFQSSSIHILLAVTVIAAAAIDLRSRQIPNWLTLSGVCAGLLLNGYVSGLPGVGKSLAGIFVGFGVYFVLYRLRAIGGGDVKLMAAVGAIVGPGTWIAVFLATAIAGGVLAIALMISRGRVRETLGNILFIARELIHFRAPHKRRGDLDVKDPRALTMPHGLAIAAGTMTCLALHIA
jgi:prepilin peptidase CpaA